MKVNENQHNASEQVVIMLILLSWGAGRHTGRKKEREGKRKQERERVVQVDSHQRYFTHYHCSCKVSTRKVRK